MKKESLDGLNIQLSSKIMLLEVYRTGDESSDFSQLKDVFTPSSKFEFHFHDTFFNLLIRTRAPHGSVTNAFEGTVFDPLSISHICPIKKCNKRYRTREGLIQHFKMHTGKKLFWCLYPKCNEGFVCQAHLDVHTRSHTKEKPFKCRFPGCNKMFSQKGNLRVHFQVHLKNLPEGMEYYSSPKVLKLTYPCLFPKCGAIFNNDYDLYVHCRLHQGHFPFKCRFPHCTNAFATLNDLHSHIHEHLPESWPGKKKPNFTDLMDNCGEDTADDETAEFLESSEAKNALQQFLTPDAMAELDSTIVTVSQKPAKRPKMESSITNATVSAIGISGPGPIRVEPVNTVEGEDGSLSRLRSQVFKSSSVSHVLNLAPLIIPSEPSDQASDFRISQPEQIMSVSSSTYPHLPEPESPPPLMTEQCPPSPNSEPLRLRASSV